MLLGLTGKREKVWAEVGNRMVSRAQPGQIGSVYSRILIAPEQPPSIPSVASLPSLRRAAA
jgi:hypothetical protein